MEEQRISVNCGFPRAAFRGYMIGARLSIEKNSLFMVKYLTCMV
jgi:hypothetical protein